MTFLQPYGLCTNLSKTMCVLFVSSRITAVSWSVRTLYLQLIYLCVLQWIPMVLGKYNCTISCILSDVNF